MFLGTEIPISINSVSSFYGGDPMATTSKMNPSVHVVAQVAPEEDVIPETECLQSEFLNFGTHEELAADAALWTAKFAATTPEQLARLDALFAEDEKEGTLPLDFTSR